MNKRRSLTPSMGMPGVAAGAHAMRRGGARRQVSDRVTLKRDGGTAHQGWALNVSKGGIRAIVDSGDDKPNETVAKLELGEEYEIFVGDPEADGNAGRRGRIVWLQEEPDGFVVGVEYIDLSGMHASAAPASSAAGAVGVTGAEPKAPESAAEPAPAQGPAAEEGGKHEKSG